MQHVLARDKQTTRKQVEPPKYVLMLHISASAKQMTIYVVAHVLHDHLHLPEAEAIQILRKALRDGGKAVIKPVTKDIGESFLADINSCPVHSEMSTEFKITLEQH